MTYAAAREAHIAESSIIDEKTGLYERSYFLRSLGSEILRAERDERPLYVALVDVDDFARFNDLFGIELGDAADRSVAGAREALEECAGGDDVRDELRRPVRGRGVRGPAQSKGARGGSPDDKTR
jgi:GGDEF domain-containing protein